MSSKGSTSNARVRTKAGALKSVGGAAMARRTAIPAVRRKATRIMRPDEKERLTQTLPAGLSSFERFFAGLLRSETSEFLEKDMDTWTTICQRLKLPVPDGPIKSYYGDKNQHFACRAALVIEEARCSIANGVVAMHKRSKPSTINTKNNKPQKNNFQRRESSSGVMVVSLVGIEPREKTGHTVLTFAIKRNGPFTPDELSNLRHGQIFACVCQNLAPTVANAHLGCVLPGNRKEIIDSKSFQVMIFKTIKKSSETKWELRRMH
jgi:hypothetical protein